ncbi:MAG: hypothetical protein RLY35_1145 [Bacteroidota bacterium]|jgi:hypothetical protein
MNMKKNIFIYLSLALGALACKPEISGELGELTNKEVGMDGNWELSKFSIQDPNSPILEQRDFTSFYTGENITPLTIHFDAATHEYHVDIEKGRNFFGDQGTWFLDDVIAPSSLYLVNTNDTTEIALGSMVTANSSEMNLSINRICSSGFKNVTYKFNLTRK